MSLFEAKQNHRLPSFSVAPNYLVSLFTEFTYRHQTNIPRPRNNVPFWRNIQRPTYGDSVVCVSLLATAQLLTLRTSFGLLLHCTIQTHFVSASATLPKVVGKVLTVSFGPSPFIISECPKMMLY